MLTLSEETVSLMFKALGDPIRLSIFEYLCAYPYFADHAAEAAWRRPRCPDAAFGPTVSDVCACVAAYQCAPSNVSFHLKELRQAELILMARCGRETLCRVNSAALEALGEYVRARRREWDSEIERASVSDAGVEIGDQEAREETRLAALASYQILDTECEPPFEEITHLAATVCAVSIAAISLVERERQWFKSIVGYESQETPRDISFCAHAIEQSEVFIVRDAAADERFAENPLVLSNPFIRTYAAVPLVTPDAQALGVLCVADQTPRDFSDTQIASLTALARLTMTTLETRKRLLQLERAEELWKREGAMHREATDQLTVVQNILSRVNS